MDTVASDIFQFNPYVLSGTLRWDFQGTLNPNISSRLSWQRGLMKEAYRGKWMG